MKPVYTIVINGKLFKMSEKQIDIICGISKNQRINMGLNLINK